MVGKWSQFCLKRSGRASTSCAAIRAEAWLQTSVQSGFQEIRGWGVFGWGVGGEFDFIYVIYLISCYACYAFFFWGGGGDTPLGGEPSCSKICGRDVAGRRSERKPFKVYVCASCQDSQPKTNISRLTPQLLSSFGACRKYQYSTLASKRLGVPRPPLSKVANPVQ